MAKELEITELRLGLPGGGITDKNEKKRAFSEISDDRKNPSRNTKSQVVGWPPVCTYRKKNSFNGKDSGADSSKMYVKVSMDGAPFLRKIDLGLHEGYHDLAVALEKLFDCFGAIGGGLRKDGEICEY
ncbi:auxin-induced protein AUX22-like, partial [Carica papaya]|uniref:auxin-induced protein AUX22-like n=1 Tax=Carica papaya TaxID=3649 RepID=UPI000B8CC984